MTPSLPAKTGSHPINRSRGRGEGFWPDASCPYASRFLKLLTSWRSSLRCAAPGAAAPLCPLLNPSPPQTPPLKKLPRKTDHPITGQTASFDSNDPTREPSTNCCKRSFGQEPFGREVHQWRFCYLRLGASLTPGNWILVTIRFIVTFPK